MPFTKQVNPQKVTVIFTFVLIVAKRRLNWDQLVISFDFMLLLIVSFIPFGQGSLWMINNILCR